MKRYFFALPLIAAVVLLGFLGLTRASAVSASPIATTAPTSTSICFTDRNATTTTAPIASSGFTVHVSVIVDATTRVRTNSKGIVTAVGTNSGCAPRTSDDFITENNGVDLPASDEIKAQALACKTSGIWEDTTTWHACK